MKTKSDILHNLGISRGLHEFGQHYSRNYTRNVPDSITGAWRMLRNKCFYSVGYGMVGLIFLSLFLLQWSGVIEASGGLSPASLFLGVIFGIMAIISIPSKALRLHVSVFKEQAEIIQENILSHTSDSLGLAERFRIVSENLANEALSTRSTETNDLGARIRGLEQAGQILRDLYIIECKALELFLIRLREKDPKITAMHPSREGIVKR